MGNYVRVFELRFSIILVFEYRFLIEKEVVKFGDDLFVYDVVMLDDIVNVVLWIIGIFVIKFIFGYIEKLVYMEDLFCELVKG